MYTKRNYGFWLTFRWSIKPFVIGTTYSALVVLICFLLHKHLNIVISIKWQPIGILGTAVAFYLGFKNNSSYDRMWEARKIWGGIVNSSRSFGASICAYIPESKYGDTRKELIYTHIAWLTALRFQLRTPRAWEHDVEGSSTTIGSIAEELDKTKLDEPLRNLLGSQYQSLEGKTNKATQILRLQSEKIEFLHEAGKIDTFKQIELQKHIQLFYDDQGRSERIKNFPFPRQYASAAVWLTTIFSFVLPFGIVDITEHQNLLELMMNTLFSGIIIWAFFLMEKIGDYSENPFEGTYNDVPITTIARSIEIDLKEMIEDQDIPKPIPDFNGFQL